MQNNQYKKSYVIGISFISALGGYLFGFDFAVIAGALPFLQQQFTLNSYWEGFATGILAIGAITGCILAGQVSDKYGRRPGLMAAAAIFLLSSLAMAVSPTRNIFLIARFTAGAGVGMASMLSPLYISEMAPAAVRGRLVAMNQLTIVLGILITNVTNYMLRNEGINAWRYMFGAGMIPSGLFLIGAYILPESPRWLLLKNKEEKAMQVLNKLGTAAYAEESFSTIKTSISGLVKGRYRDAFQKLMLPALLAGVGLAVFQQFCGINTVFNYAPKIFESIGASKNAQLEQNVFIGLVNVVTTVLAMILIDKLGRKPLMLLGAGGLAVLYVVIVKMLFGGSTSVAWYLLSAIGLYALTLAPVTWVLISEIFPAKIRSVGITIAIVCLWAAYFVLVFTFPILFEKLHEHTFYIYAGICAIGFFFVLFRIKETKGKTLEEVEQTMMGH